jgi:hypothetical protein
MEDYVKKPTAYNYANTLAELGVGAELDAHADGPARWCAESVSGN